jgi:O-antigen/teichoic acid export membrane protein
VSDVPVETGVGDAPVKRFARRAGETTLANIVGRALAALGGVLIARSLGPADRGVLAITVLAATVTSTLFSAGVDLWALRELTPPRAPVVRGVLRHHYVRAVPLAFVLYAVGGLVVVAIVGYSAGLAMAGAVFAAVSVVFMSAALLPLARGQGVRYGAALVAEGTPVLMVALVFLATDDASVFVALLAWTAGRLAGALVGWRSVRGPAATPTAPEYREVLRYGLPSAFGVLLTVAAYRLDAVLVGVLASAEEVGLYVSAAALVEVMYVLPDSAAHVLLGRVRDDDGGLLTGAVARVVVILVAIGGALLAALGPVVMVLVYGDAFEDGWVALPWLAAAGVALTVWKLLVYDLAGRGDTVVRVHTGLLAVGLMLALDLALIPPFGIAGAAAASMVAYLGAAVAVARRWARATGSPASAIIGLRRGDLDALRTRS